ncbi:MAG: phospholipase [bacterium]|nr:phospholipase [bacterium]
MKKKLLACAVSQLCSTVFFALRTAILPMLLLVLLSATPGQAEEGLIGKFNLNTATSKELQQLPFIGARKARAIIEYRNSHGPFTELSELLESDTIGIKTFEAIKPYLKLSGASQLHRPDTEPGSVTIRSRIMTSPGEIRILPDEEYFQALLDAIHDAEREIVLAMFLFKITDSAGNRAAMVLDQLLKAKKRGVEVRVLLERSGYDDELNKENRRVADKLHKQGVTVVFDGPNTTTHTKAVVVDKRFVLVGSHNLTHSALAGNHEFSLFIDNRDLATEMLRYLISIGGG